MRRVPYRLLPQLDREVSALQGLRALLEVAPRIALELLDPLIDELVPLLDRHDGAHRIADRLAQSITPEAASTAAPIAGPRGAQELWEFLGQHYLFQLVPSRPENAFQIFHRLYEHMLRHQSETNRWCMKGMTLVWMAECSAKAGHSWTALRYLMLTLIEDAIRDKGEIDPNGVGSYFRLVWSGHLSEAEFHRYAREAFRRYETDQIAGGFPEWILQHFDQSWMNQIPSSQEASKFVSNPFYVQHLVARLGDKTGNSLEMLAQYLLSCVPGCRTYRRTRTHTSDLDIVCAIDGPELDFRSTLGRFFACECKDWPKKSLDVATIKVFSQALQLINAKFGVVFCRKGLSGKGKNRDAEHEQRIIYQRLGIVIVAVDDSDFEELAKGINFVSRLREKYEAVRLNLPT